MPSTKNQLKKRQVRAIRLSREIGAKIAEDHPEIEDLYCKILDIEKDIPQLFHADPALVTKKLDAVWSLERIAKQINAEVEYELSHRIAVVSVGYALQILISDIEEQKRLRILHHQAGALRRYKTHGNSFTLEDCKTGADNLYANMSEEEKRQKSLNALIAQGRTPVSNEERKKIYRYLRQSEYIRQTGRNAGLSNMTLIADEINRELHYGLQVRTGKNLSIWLYKQRKASR